jgi:hypothetical protein
VTAQNEKQYTKQYKTTKYTNRKQKHKTKQKYNEYLKKHKLSNQTVTNNSKSL